MWEALCLFPPKRSRFLAFYLEAEGFPQTPGYALNQLIPNCLPALLEICLWYSSRASMHFHVHTRRRPVTSRTVSIRNTKIQPAKSELDSDLIHSGFWTGFEPLRRNVEDSDEHLFFSSPLTICKSLLPDPGGRGEKKPQRKGSTGFPDIK